MKTFGSEMERLRLEGKVTLKQLSGCVNLSIGYLSDMENERKNPPSLEVVSRIEKCLGIQNNELVNLAEAFRDNVLLAKFLSKEMIKRPALTDFVIRIYNLPDCILESIIKEYSKGKKHEETI